MQSPRMALAGRVLLAVTAVTATLGSAVGGCAQPVTKLPASVDPQRVAEVVKVEMTRQRIPGVSLAIVRAGQIVYVQGFGLANVELNVAVKPETVFQSGSVGKQFTATAVMMLVEEGKIGLDDSIAKYLPESPEPWRPITVRRLLSHTGGMTDYPKDFDFRRDYTEDELLARAMQVPLAFAPGEKWSYSNLGYVTLGILIHRVTGQFYGDFLQERIFKPLGMSTARIISEADIVPNRAAGYRLVRGELKNQNWVSPTLNTTADGALYLTTLDMAKWDAALCTDKLLEKTILTQMWTPVRLNNGSTYPYGFGWSLEQVDGHRLIAHGGSWQGFKAYIGRYVDDALTIVVFANLAQAQVERIAYRVGTLCNPELELPEPKPIKDREPQVTTLVGKILSETAAGSLKGDALTPEFAAEFLPDGLYETAEFLKPLGKQTAIALLWRTEDGGLRSYRYLVTFSREQVICVLALTKDGKIAEMGVEPW
ncbi:MAG TPA: serine hydrolase domain-containing protein [Thermoanaerobaculaceae bacterium]|nr:serine hydrolase domain-containing protein [Thermoanaerobaculaceae bacterium]